MKNYFPNNLKFLRTKEGLTQGELAKKLNKDYSTIGKWELGQRNPIMADMMKISKIFNVQVQDLVEKNLRSIKENEDDEFEVLYKRYKAILTKEDKDKLIAVIKDKIS